MYRIGIDLGGTNIAAGLVNDNYEIVVKKSVPTLAQRESEAIVDDMAELCRDVCREAGVSLDEIESVGVASPGIADTNTGIVEYSCNLPFKKLPLADMLKEKLGVKQVKIGNDANAAALGEAVAGAAKGSTVSVMITLGTGVGGGIIIDNKMYCGFNAAAGELGHIVIEAGGRPCNCGRRGCWESYSSATALIKMTNEKIEECRREGRASKLLEVTRVSGRTACDLMRQGDEAAKEVYDEYIRYLATGLVNIVNIFQPEVISLGGGVSGEGQSLIDSLLPIIKKEQYGGGIVKETEIKIAELGNSAGMIGAAAL